MESSNRMSISSTTFSLSLMQLPAISRLRSSFLKKLPEPLRRAVADCLSSPLTSALEPSRTLRDYLADPATRDLAYNAILGHTIAERERSPAVVSRCVTLFKRYLLRYKPSEETLLQIDHFCSTIIAECDINLNRPWSRSLNHQTGALAISTNTSPLPVSSFTSEAILKSLSYVRSLVAQHIPKRHFQPASFAGPPSALGQSLPTLSSLLSKSFNSQLCPASVTESVEKDSVTSSISKLSKIEKIDEKDKLGFIAHDILQWRWLEKQQSSSMKADSDHAVNSQGMRAYNFLEVGAAALLEGDIGAKMKGQPWKYFGTDDMPYLDQLLQASPVTSFTNSASACPHLRAITASKRTKAGPRQVWEDSPVSTFRPRARQLFQYRYYSEQQPLRLNPAEVCEVFAAVCSEPSPNTNVMMMSTRLRNNSGKPSMDVAVSILIKLVIDTYILDYQIATPLTLSLLEEMLSSSKTACRVQAFDLVLNFGVHAHLLEPIIVDDASPIEEEYSLESYYDSDTQLMAQGSRKGNYPNKLDTFSAINNFESWVLNILYEILLLLVQTEEKEESVWASALSCLLYFVCDNGKIHRNRLQVLDIRVIKALIEISRKNSWAELVHCKLISMLANMLYEVPDEVVELLPSTPKFLVNQLDLIGGVQFLLREYALVNSRGERKNLHSVLFDYVLHQINENCIATGINEYSDDEIQPLASLLAQTNAAEAFHISVKLGVEGIGELLRRSIASALSRYPNSERLNMLLDFVTEKFDSLISSFTHLDGEFSHMIQITKIHKSLENVEIIALRNDINLQAKHSWVTLHSLLHSERIAYRQNGYIWLGDLLISEISGESNGTIWSNIEFFQQKFAQVGKQDSSDMSDIPLPISLMCGLLKSRHNYIRWGFLFVLERLLMRCKFLLDEYEMQQSRSSDLGSGLKDWHLEKAHALIDIMSSALLFQINEKDCTNKYETDRINILKMCDILLFQLCLRVPPATALPNGDDMQHDRNLNCFSSNKKFDSDNRALKQDTYLLGEHIEEEADGTSNYPKNYHLVHETAAMAALLLQGQAFAPMQLIVRIPPDLLFWPLMQLAGAATDDITLGVAVGSKGRGNLPGAASDIRATLLLLLIGKCTADPVAFKAVGKEHFFMELLNDRDSRVAYYSSAFLLKRMMTESPEKYQHMLQNLLFKAQQSNNEKLLENPYLQMCGILQLENDLGFDL
ncbi:hypothetical protein AAZX31_20G089100 [Glycine max]|uniref:uncharacterized protein isoform X1 n=1 Tax=Glycine max TaxID=3847 RepID=UPI0002954DEE|nr:uncharacterized protein LOC100793037 isoform X1 [Glycine max]XP_006605830.1 uncharacterized protein LOC100793037 isoform X1 [Glycine max]XP_006605831.1 uncharacterized protein LOC100793037 isoform X1 [Glycine max]KAG4394785.1 hypothetical protein GLYMA_20G099500v4 [Glycine max]KAG4394787.1 hypothetical protein GLYMA_20G099500v4 [Glycine max]KRG90566.2 hypothetical protein GLYMA_20G099500v4 [Glycine max]|eukprot:XP_006605829.1 uncharacterized protein LOC100793037 isoform X1 [Glycine max]